MHCWSLLKLSMTAIQIVIVHREWLLTLASCAASNRCLCKTGCVGSKLAHVSIVDEAFAPTQVLNSEDLTTVPDTQTYDVPSEDEENNQGAVQAAMKVVQHVVEEGGEELQLCVYQMCM